MDTYKTGILTGHAVRPSTCIYTLENVSGDVCSRSITLNLNYLRNNIRCSIYYVIKESHWIV